MRHILIVVDLTLREARRRKLMWIAIALGAVFIALYGVGFYFIYRDFSKHSQGRDIMLDAGFNFVILAGLYVVSFLGVMLAVLTSVGTLSGEIASHTIQVLAVKPLKRGAIVLGKWIGLSLMLALYIILLTGGLIAVTWAISGYVPPHAIRGVLLIVLQAIILLTVSIFGGTHFSTVANGLFAFMLYGLAFIGGWIEQIGSFSQNETAVDIGIISSLLIPSEAMWRMASYIMQPAAIRSLGVSPFSIASAPSTAMLIYALAYVVGLLLLAIHSFNQRDL